MKMVLRTGKSLRIYFRDGMELALASLDEPEASSMLEPNR
jgi:hypothetical protein